MKLDFFEVQRTYPEISRDTFILNSPELINIRGFIESKISYFAKEVMRSNKDLVITQSWVNRQIKGAHHHEHMHPHSILSGVWYPAASESFNPITFKQGIKKEIDLYLKFLMIDK